MWAGADRGPPATIHDQHVVKSGLSSPDPGR
jgi:hypothetical protein